MLTKWIVAALVIYAVWWLLRKPRTAKKRSPLADARQVLGVGRQADESEIRAAHRRLMGEMHPDRGGSELNARRVNAARDTLLTALRDGR